jgi:ketosteroid isomerase-like protein
MRKSVFVIALLFVMTAYPQSKKNGTIYVEHPAINVVEDMVKAYVAGDAEKVGSYLSDNFRAISGTNPNPDAEGASKENFMNGVTWWKENVAYFSINREKGAYPDALEYKDDNQNDVIWVQTWERMKGVHNETGVKLDMPMYRMFIVNKDNKITRIFNYADREAWDEVRASYSTRTNGTLYKYHENINKVRRMIRAFEHGDSDKAYSFYDEKATFRSIHMPPGERATIEENKAAVAQILEAFEIESIDMVGYPDYLHYEQGDSRVVQSWWNFRVKRKADDKQIKLPVMYLHNFNDEGMITSSSVYYSAKLMED